MSSKPTRGRIDEIRAMLPNWARTNNTGAMAQGMSDLLKGYPAKKGTANPAAEAVMQNEEEKKADKTKMADLLSSIEETFEDEPLVGNSGRKAKQKRVAGGHH